MNKNRHSHSTAARRGGERALILLAASAVLALAAATGCSAQEPARRGGEVVTPKTFWAKVQAAQPGAVILLDSGDYGPVKFYGKKLAKPGLRIEAKPGAKAVFSSLTLENSEGIDVRGVEVASAGEGVAVTVVDSADVSLSGFKVHNAAGAGHGGVGFLLRDSTGVSVTGSEVTELGSGIGHVHTSHLTISNNTLHHLQTDGIFGGGSSHVVVSGNHIGEFHPQPGDHPDAIQFWGNRDGTPGTDVAIRNNVIDRGTGEVIQGIFIESTDDLTITGNAMTGTMYNGISLSTVKTGLVEDNFVQGFTDMDSRIVVRGASSDVTVRNNVAQSIFNLDSEGKNPRYKEDHNSTVRAAKPGDSTAMKAWLSQHPQH
ncbi:right-handed parallel beta-helix repeat-containing protein [Phenylobacterium sp.]|uniref:right-handed parallel beta-helix repeat-containing protein n=1 Tax=Phenylobacterium sp. TaxID=1871053 RepID=UPI003568E00F